MFRLPTFEDFKKLESNEQKDLWRDRICLHDWEYIWADETWSAISQDEENYIDNSTEKEIYADIVKGTEDFFWRVLYDKIPKEEVLKYADASQLKDYQTLKDITLMEDI
jgi:hypothetical protein